MTDEQKIEKLEEYAKRIEEIQRRLNEIKSIREQNSPKLDKDSDGVES